MELMGRCRRMSGRMRIRSGRQLAVLFLLWWARTDSDGALELRRMIDGGQRVGLLSKKATVNRRRESFD